VTESDSLRVLFYHRVGDPRAEDLNLAPGLIATTPAGFERQVRHLSRAYHPVGCDEVLAALDGTHSLPPRAVLVTFDDGYRDFLDIAWPILRRYRVPCALFVSTAYVDDPRCLFWWDSVWQCLARTRRTTLVWSDEVSLPVTTLAERRIAWSWLISALKLVSPRERQRGVARLAETLGVAPEPAGGVLGWNELRLLAAQGVAIGAHTRTHELLDQLDADALTWEIAGCRDDIARELARALPIFAYPNGNVSSAAVSTVGSAGYRLAFTTRPGLNEGWTSHPLRIRRDGHSTSLLRFALKLMSPVGRRRARALRIR